MQTPLNTKEDKTMKQSITESYFVDQIVGDEYNSMSYDGAKALFEYFEQLEEAGALLLPNGTITNIRDEIDFDKVEIRCTFTEYENIEAIAEQYDHIKTLNDLRDYTQVIEVPNSDRLIIENF